MGTSEDGPRLERLIVGALEANCYLVTDRGSGDAVIVDPGNQAKRILDAVRDCQAHVVAVIHTHGHFDHIGATEQVVEALGGEVAVYSHPADTYLYERAARLMGASFGYSIPERLLTPSHPLHDGMTIPVGSSALEVIHTPGHTPGSVSLLCPGQFLLSGDTLFRRGIGRTDLPGGDEDAIYESILTRLYPLPGELAVWPGHGESTTIAQERRSNPFVQAPV